MGTSGRTKLGRSFSLPKFRFRLGKLFQRSGRDRLRDSVPIYRGSILDKSARTKVDSLDLPTTTGFREPLDKKTILDEYRDVLEGRSCHPCESRDPGHLIALDSRLRGNDGHFSQIENSLFNRIINGIVWLLTPFKNIADAYAAGNVLGMSIGGFGGGGNGRSKKPHFANLAQVLIAIHFISDYRGKGVLEIDQETFIKTKFSIDKSGTKATGRQILDSLAYWDPSIHSRRFTGTIAEAILKAGGYPRLFEHVVTSWMADHEGPDSHEFNTTNFPGKELRQEVNEYFDNIHREKAELQGVISTFEGENDRDPLVPFNSEFLNAQFSLSNGRSLTGRQVVTRFAELEFDLAHPLSALGIPIPLNVSNVSINEAPEKTDTNLAIFSTMHQIFADPHTTSSTQKTTKSGLSSGAKLTLVEREDRTQEIAQPGTSSLTTGIRFWNLEHVKRAFLEAGLYNFPNNFKFPMTDAFLRTRLKIGGPDRREATGWDLVRGLAHHQLREKDPNFRGDPILAVTQLGGPKMIIQDFINSKLRRHVVSLLKLRHQIKEAEKESIRLAGYISEIVATSLGGDIERVKDKRDFLEREFELPDGNSYSGKALIAKYVEASHVSVGKQVKHDTSNSDTTIETYDGLDSVVDVMSRDVNILSQLSPPIKPEEIVEETTNLGIPLKERVSFEIGQIVSTQYPVDERMRGRELHDKAFLDNRFLIKMDDRDASIFGRQLVRLYAYTRLFEIREQPWKKFEHLPFEERLKAAVDFFGGEGLVIFDIRRALFGGFSPSRPL